MQSEVARVFPSIKGIPLKPIHEKCSGCKKTTEFEEFVGVFCSIYPNPAVFWRRGGCPAHSHSTIANGENDQSKVRVGQQKQKKGRR